MKWEFSSGGYIKIYNGTKVAWFSICDLKIKIAWQEGDFTPDDWNEVLICVKKAKKILKRIRRI